MPHCYLYYFFCSVSSFSSSSSLPGLQVLNEKTPPELKARLEQAVIQMRVKAEQEQLLAQQQKAEALKGKGKKSGTGKKKGK
jgi:hypothetical protein